MRGVAFRASSARSAVSFSLEVSGFKFCVSRRDEASRIVHSLLPDNPRLSTKTLDSSHIDPCQLCDVWQICELEKNESEHNGDQVSLHSFSSLIRPFNPHSNPGR